MTTIRTWAAPARQALRIVLVVALLGSGRAIAAESCGFVALADGSTPGCGIRSDGALQCWERDPSITGLFSSVTVGSGFQCGIRTNGVLECWGNSRLAWNQPPGIFTQVSANYETVCALRLNGTVLCRTASPFDDDPPSPPGKFTRISVGYGFGCGIREDGNLACWGSNSSGQASPPAGTFTRVRAGDNHACAVRRDGTILCWGDDRHGQATPPAGTFVDVSSGDAHSCGLRPDGSVQCWGWNDYGQADAPAGSFVTIASGGIQNCAITLDGGVECWGRGLKPPGMRYSTIATGRYFGCGLRADDGRVACWGDYIQSAPEGAAYVQLSAFGSRLCGLRADGTGECWSSANNPDLTPLREAFEQIVVGAGFDCGRRSDGSVECEGQGQYGEENPLPGVFTSLAAGQWNVCGIRSDASVECWGRSDEGQTTPPAGIYESVSVGLLHACGVTSAQEIVCWGADYAGETEAPAGPFVHVAAGGQRTCGLRPDGSAECWGLRAEFAIPPGPYAKLSMAARSDQGVCGLRQDGTVECWSSHYGMTGPGPIACEACGNGVRTGEEECDDGNTASHDGCSDTCLIDCPMLPRSNCGVAGLASVAIRDSDLDAKDSLRWKWSRGSISVFDLEAARDNICLYRDGILAGELLLPAASGWQQRAIGSWRYADKSGAIDGVLSLELQEGSSPDAFVSLKAMGAALPDGLLPATSYTIQLVTPDGNCWGSDFAGDRVRTTSFKARWRP